MRNRIAAPLMLIIALSCFAGCNETTKEHLQGKWVGDSVEGFAEHQRSTAAGWLNGSAFEFQGSRVSVTIPAESPRHGTFKVTEKGERAFSVAFLRETGESDEAAFELEKDGRLRWMLDNGRSFLLKKVN